MNPQEIPDKPAIFRWSIARFIANSRLPQVASFLPAIGYALIWSDSFQNWISSKELLGSSILPLTVRLQLLWWGAIFMTAGWIAYLWHCPKEIRRSGEPDDYIIEQFRMPNLRRLEHARKIGVDALKRFHPGDDRPLMLGGLAPCDVRRACEQVQLTNIFQPTQSHNVDVLCRLQYHTIDEANPRWCRFCVISLILGALLFLAPSFEVSLRVFRKLVEGTLGFFFSFV